MKLSGMDAVSVNIKVNVGSDQGQVKVGSPASESADIPGVTNSADKAADLQQKIFWGSAAAGSADLKKYQQDDQAVYDKMLKDAVERVNKVLSPDNRRFEITIHEKTKDVLVKVVDTQTNETIKEIPPKKIIDLVVNLCEMAGIIYDAKG